MSSNDLLVNLGMRIKAVRITKKMTQNELAAKCKLEKTGISRIEAGLTNPTVKTLHKISKTLEVHIAELFKD